LFANLPPESAHVQCIIVLVFHAGKA
jgi:hypothetical protein